MKTHRILARLVLCAVLAGALFACAPPAAEPAPQSGATLQPSPLPTAAPTSALSDQPYASPSGAFSLVFPRGWNCSETGQYVTDCQSPGGEAAIRTRVTGTGYELLQADFEALAHAELVYQYGGKMAYTELYRAAEEGALTLRATWQEGETLWQSEECFYRSGAAVFQLSFSAPQASWEEYQPLFEAVAASLAPSAAGSPALPLYAFRREYTDPYVLFTLQVPTSWSKFRDIESIEKTILEGFISPDYHASIQVAVYQQSEVISQELKATKTMEIMRKRYGNDLSIGDDKALPDGREWLVDWSAETKGVRGDSFFDTYGSTLFIYSLVYDRAGESLYLPLLWEIADSFRRK